MSIISKVGFTSMVLLFFANQVNYLGKTKNKLRVAYNGQTKEANKFLKLFLHEIKQNMARQDIE